MSKKKVPTPEEQVMNLDPSRNMPQGHKDAVTNIFSLLQEEGYAFWDAQTVTNLALAATQADDPARALESAKRVADIIMESTDNDKMYFHPILQKLSEKLNAAINKTALGDIEIEEE